MFLKRFNSHILFTNFKDGWEKDIAIAINKLNANYLDSNTTRLAFDKSLIS